MAWHWVDYVILLVVGLSVITGLIRGFVKELIALGVWIAAIWIGFHYSPALGALLKPYIPDHTLRGLLSFIVLLLGVLLAGGLLSTALSFLLNRSALRGTDRLLGMGFGFLRGAFIVALLIGIMNLTSLVKSADVKESVLYARLKPLSTWMFGFMPKIIDQVQTLEKKGEKDEQSNKKGNDDMEEVDELPDTDASDEDDVLDR